MAERTRLTPDELKHAHGPLCGVTLEDGPCSCLVHWVEALQTEADEHRKKWGRYEREYVLPVFEWMKELGFDLQQAVDDNPGKNCVELAFEWMKAKLVKKQGES